MKTLDGEAINVAPGSPLRVWIPLAPAAERALLARMFSGEDKAVAAAAVAPAA